MTDATNTDLIPTQPPANKPQLPPNGSPELIELICSEYEKGRTLVDICEEFGIDRPSVYFWVSKDERAADRFARAKQGAAKSEFDDAKWILDRLKRFEPPKWLPEKAYNAWVKAQEVAANGKMRIAAITYREEFGEKIETINKSVSIQYVVDLGMNGAQPVDVPPECQVIDAEVIDPKKFRQTVKKVANEASKCVKMTQKSKKLVRPDLDNKGKKLKRP